MDTTFVNKTCSKCGVEKSLTGFSKCKCTFDGLQTWCKACRSDTQRLYRSDLWVRKPDVATRLEKACCTCKVEKSLTEFYRSKCESDGHSSECKLCAKKRTSTPEGKECSRRKQKRYRDNPANREKIKNGDKVQKSKPHVKMKDAEYKRKMREDPAIKAIQYAANKRWRELPGVAERLKAKNRENRATLYSKVIFKKFGLSEEDRAAMLLSQNSACAICGSNTPGGQGTWHIDHNHATNEVRGILCATCNNGLGLFKDNTDFLGSAIKYLENPPSRKVLKQL